MCSGNVLWKTIYLLVVAKRREDRVGVNFLSHESVFIELSFLGCDLCRVFRGDMT